MILTTAEIARDFTDTPVYLSASVQGSGYRQGNVVDGLWHDDFMGSKLLDDGRSAVRGSGMGPEEIDCGQFYESFTGQVPTSFEDHKLCAVGEGGRLEAKQVADPDTPHVGAFPINTSGAICPRSTRTASTWQSKRCDSCAAIRSTRLAEREPASSRPGRPRCRSRRRSSATDDEVGRADSR